MPGHQVFNKSKKVEMILKAEPRDKTLKGK